MSADERVVFSGKFAVSDADHLAERKVTEVESMVTPAFVMVFGDNAQQE